MKTFPYAVKYHGKFYPPNTPIEEQNVEPVEEPAQTAENAAENVEPVEVDKETEEKPEPVKKAAKGRKKDDA